MASLDLDSLKVIFFEEADEHLATMEATLLALEHAPGDRELLDQIFRAAHSIKGGSGTFGFHDVQRFTHGLEGLLDRLRGGVMSLSPAIANLLLRATDALDALMSATQRGEPSPDTLDALSQEIAQVIASAVQPEITAPASEDLAEENADPPQSVLPLWSTYTIAFAPGADLFRRGMDPLLVIRDLAELGEVFDVELDGTALPLLEELDPETCYVAWRLTLATDRTPKQIRDVFAFVEDESKIEITSDQFPEFEQPQSAAESTQKLPPQDATVPEPTAAASVPKPVARSTVRVDTDKIDKLINLVGELVIAQSMVTAAMSDSTPDAAHRLREAVSAMDRNTRELQDRVMAVRMVPIGTVFNRFPRMVRDLAASLGKRISLVVEGEDTELDKGMVELLADPLTHIVRNAVDHGVERVHDRRAAGKHEEGTVSIRAFHQGGNVVIEVADDGRGLQPDKIATKARALGLIAGDATPTTEELHNLVFAPGFSTAETVSDVSGRGVGMDVVKRNVDALNGAIAFTSEPGKGSVMRIRLPLTMAIIDGLPLRVGSQTFVLPLISIVESFRPKREQLMMVLGKSEIIRVRGEALPLVRLHDMFGIQGAETDPCKALVCIVDAGAQRVGFLVDELLGQAQVVVKTLETNYHRVDGAMGATILGDGRVALILDVQAIARRATGGDKEGGHGPLGHAA